MRPPFIGLGVVAGGLLSDAGRHADGVTHKGLPPDEADETGVGAVRSRGVAAHVGLRIVGGGLFTGFRSDADMILGT